MTAIPHNVRVARWLFAAIDGLTAQFPTATWAPIPSDGTAHTVWVMTIPAFQVYIVTHDSYVELRVYGGSAYREFQGIVNDVDQVPNLVTALHKRAAERGLL